MLLSFHCLWAPSQRQIPNKLSISCFWALFPGRENQFFHFSNLFTIPFLEDLGTNLDQEFHGYPSRMLRSQVVMATLPQHSFSVPSLVSTYSMLEWLTSYWRGRHTTPTGFFVRAILVPSVLKKKLKLTQEMHLPLAFLASLFSWDSHLGYRSHYLVSYWWRQEPFNSVSINLFVGMLILFSCCYKYSGN